MLGPQVDPQVEAPASQADFKSQETLITELQGKVIEQENMYKNILQKYKKCKEEKERQSQKLHQMIHYYEEQLRHSKEKIETREIWLEQCDEKIENLSKTLKDWKDLVETGRMVAEDLKSRLRQAEKDKQYYIYLLQKQREDIKRLHQEREQEREQERIDNQGLRKVFQREIQELQEKLQDILAELSSIQWPRNDFRECTSSFPPTNHEQACQYKVQDVVDKLKILVELSKSSRFRDATEHDSEIQLTSEEQRLSSVAFGGSMPSLPVLNEFGCKYSCVILSLSFHCQRNGVGLCPLCLVKVATLNVAKSDGCQDLNDVVYKCEQALKLLEGSKFVKKMRSETGINDMEALDKALRYVTGAEDSPLRGGLLVLEYRDRRIGHCVTYWKDRGKIRIFDPQKGGWWRETDYGRIVAVRSYQVNWNLVKSAEKASCLLSRLPPL